MKSSCKYLGDYVKLVDYRNTDNITDRVLGISIDKYFMPSVANVIGTDLSKYKLLRKGVFACNPMHVGRDEKLPVALYDEDVPGLVSPAYFMFEIRDTSVVDPEYLMLWFRRKEFDRQCWFRTDASVRGGITWDALCEVEISVPSLERQMEIVKAYQSVTDRITLKQKINDNLVSSAQEIYKKMFVDGIDVSNLPEGWSFSALGNVAILSAGGDKPAVCNDFPTEMCSIPIFSNGIDKEGLYGFTDKAKIYEESVTVSARGTIGYVFLREEPYVPIVRLISVIPKNNYVTAKYLYFVLRMIDNQSTGTSQQQITVPDFNKRQILVPALSSIKDFTSRIEPIFESIKQNKSEIQSLVVLQKNLLTLLGR